MKIDSKNIVSVIIGVKDYSAEDLPKLRAAERNANRFYDFLLERDGRSEGKNAPSGVPDGNILFRTNGATESGALRKEILGFLKNKITDDTQLVIAYYSGHGAYSINDNKYYLSVTQTSEEDFTGTAIDMDDLAAILVGTRKTVIMIIDSCFSENAFESFSSRHPLYILASSAFNKTSKYPENEEFSVFSSILLEILNEGSSNVGPEITLQEIYRELKNRLAANNMPEPKYLDKNGASSIVIAQNRFQQAPDPFSMDSVIKRIHHALYPKSSIDDNRTKNVLESYPSLISAYLQTILAANKEQTNLINDPDFFLNFYSQILDLLTYITIKDLRENKKLKDQDRSLLNAWKKPGFSNHKKVEILKLACSDYPLFVKEMNGKALFLKKIDKLQRTIDSGDHKANFFQFRDEIFNLIAALEFFKNYTMLAVRLIEVKRSYFNAMSFKHEMSLLYGACPKNYSFNDYGVGDYEDGILYNAVLLFEKSATPEKKYMNLWPFIIDGHSNDKGAQMPQLCLFQGIEEVDDERHYIYKQTQYIKERGNPVEYASLYVFPDTEEWNEYVKL